VWLATPARLFNAAIPFLLQLATLTFASGERAGLALRRVVRVGPGSLPGTQFVIAIYGGYFGGAVGLIMMAVWSLPPANADLKAMAPTRVLLVSATNGDAVVWFIAAGAVRWLETLVVMGASIISGYLGALIGRGLPARVVRGFVVVLSATVTAVFFGGSFRQGVPTEIADVSRGPWEATWVRQSSSGTRPSHPL
jgi:uncharacterized membrane protein YfcA